MNKDDGNAYIVFLHVEKVPHSSGIDKEPLNAVFEKLDPNMLIVNRVRTIRHLLSQRIDCTILLSTA